SAKISTAAVFAKTTIASTATATAGKAIAMTTVQKSLVAAVLAVSVGSGIYEALLASAARKQVNALKEREIALSEQSSRQHDDETRQLAKIAGADNDRLNRDSAELLKLRGEVAVLRREAAKIPSLQKELAERQ